MNAIDLAIFGAESRSLADALSDTSMDTDELMLELGLEHAGQHYRIRRTYSPRGRGKATLDFETLATDHDPGERDQWEPLTRESAKETQSLIEATIGLSRDTFRASAFLQQGDGAAFTEAQPRDRKRILGEVLGLARWDVLLGRVRADKNDLQASDVALVARLTQAEETAATLPVLEREHGDLVEAETIAADNVADLERSHAELAQQYQEAREHQARRTAADAEHREASQALAVLDQQVARASEAAQQISLATEELRSLPAYPPLDELQAREADLTAAVTAFEHAQIVHVTALQQAQTVEAQRQTLLLRSNEAHTRVARIRAVIHDLEATPQDEAICDRCKQVLAGSARAVAIESMGKEANAHAEEDDRLLAEAAAIEIPAVPAKPEGEPPTQELALARTAIQRAQLQQATTSTLTERIRHNEQLLDEQPSDDLLIAARELVLAKQARLVALGDPPDLAGITANDTLVADQLRTARTSLDQARTAKARIEERLAVAKAAAAQSIDLARERDALQAQLDVVLGLERAFSPNGIPALIIENSAIPYLETEATRILAELGTSYRVELRTQAELKSGDGLRDTLDVIISGEQGERPYETFSGGERTRINLALRIALARLLAHRRGAESRLLCIDEPEFLDEQGTAALVDVLRGLEVDFDKLYIVSHVPGLRDSFDMTLTVVKTDGRSSVVEAGVFEEMVA